MHEKKRLFVLVEKLVSTETFLQRDIDNFSREFDTKIIEISRFRHRYDLPLRLCKSHYRCRLAHRICSEHTINDQDIVLAYWANYVLSIGSRIADFTHARLQTCCHANDIFCNSYLGRIDPSRIDKYIFCCRKSLEFAVGQFNLPANQAIFSPHQLPDLPRWKMPESNQFTIINIARDVPKKNLPAVFACVNYLREAIPNAKFIQIGLQNRQLLKPLEKLIPMELQNEVDFPSILTAMMESHLFIYGSKIAKNGDRDGMPNALREAGEIGLPVVCEKGWANDEVVFKGPVLIVESLVDEKEKIMRWVRELYPAMFQKG
jgi:glycosyltransferase involved in cell wall biosynthesis